MDGPMNEPMDGSTNGEEDRRTDRPVDRSMYGLSEGRSKKQGLESRVHDIKIDSKNSLTHDNELSKEVTFARCNCNDPLILTKLTIHGAPCSFYVLILCNF